MPTLKEIVADRNRVAKFSHYIDGSLYYAVDVNDKTYQFPINIFDKEDIGTTTFLSEFRAITLMRYIRKALQSENFIRVK